jgi:glycosyltransferase involved in cell wall biosynthesis
MHILVIPTTYPSKHSQVSGIFFQDQARALKRSGFKVGVIAPIFRSLRIASRGLFRYESGMTIDIEDGIPTYRYHQWAWLSKFGKGDHILWERAARHLFNQYTQVYGKPDVIHAQEAHYAGVFASKLKREHAIPYVLTEHSSFYARGLIRDWQMPGLKYAFRNANHRVVVSPQLGTVLENTFGKEVCPWTPIPNILDARLSHFPLPVKDLTSGSHRFLNVAIMTTIKGQVDLLQAFFKAFKRTEDVQLRLGGDGPLREELQRLTVELGIENIVHFLGTLNREQVLKEMQGCDAFVLSSHYETFGVVLIEALACGKPVLATACGGPESIINAHNGLLVPPKDIEALADGLIKMVQNSSRYDPQRIRKDCLDRFGEDVVAGQLKDIFLNVVQRSKKVHI